MLFTLYCFSYNLLRAFSVPEKFLTELIPTEAWKEESMMLYSSEKPRSASWWEVYWQWLRGSAGRRGSPRLNPTLHWPPHPFTLSCTGVWSLCFSLLLEPVFRLGFGFTGETFLISRGVSAFFGMSLALPTVVVSAPSPLLLTPNSRAGLTV